MRWEIYAQTWETWAFFIKLLCTSVSLILQSCKHQWSRRRDGGGRSDSCASGTAGGRAASGSFGKDMGSRITITGYYCNNIRVKLACLVMI